MGYGGFERVLLKALELKSPGAGANTGLEIFRKKGDSAEPSRLS
jgi:hypothetical protein